MQNEEYEELKRVRKADEREREDKRNAEEKEREEKEREEERKADEKEQEEEREADAEFDLFLQRMTLMLNQTRNKPVPAMVQLQQQQTQLPPIHEEKLSPKQSLDDTMTTTPTINESFNNTEAHDENWILFLYMMMII